MASIEMLFKKEVNRQALNISSKMLAIANVENLSKKLFLTLTVLAIGSGVATFIVFVRAGAEGPDPNLVIAFLYLNLTLMLVIGVLVAHRLVRLWSRRRQGVVGTQLHTRLVMLFSFVAVIPTIVAVSYTHLTLPTKRIV